MIKKKVVFVKESHEESKKRHRTFADKWADK